MIKNFQLKKNITYIFLLIFLLTFFDLFKNTYLILKMNYEKRLVFNYGYCEKTSYGFVKYIKEKYNLKKNIHIHNDDKSVPYSASFYFEPKLEFSKDYLILLNYEDKKSLIDINEYDVLDKYKNCFFLKKK